MDTPRLSEILAAGRLAAPPGSTLRITGADPVLPSRYAAGEVAAVALGLAGAGAARLHELRGGEPQAAEVDVQAAASTLLGFVFQQSEGAIDLVRHQSPLTAPYQAADGRWIHLHGGFPRLREGLLELLGCGAEPAEIESAVRGWEAQALEDAVGERDLCAAVMRTEAEWAAHPQGRALAPLPALEITRIGDAPPEPLAGAARPLSGIRALDLTRVLAGPTCGRTLAEHGADVLRVGAERLPSIEPFVVETGRGKRNAFLDLDRAEDADRLRALARRADVFTQGYRPGRLAQRGFGPEELAALRPGIVYVSVSCYGGLGPWAGRAGWEQLAQSSVGITVTEGGDQAPRLIPAAATDYTTGTLAAYGVLCALARRAEEGGSWHVQASLCQTGMWLTRLGAPFDPEAAAGHGDLASRLESCDTAWGRLTHLAPVVRLGKTPPRWERPPSPLGTHSAEWLEA